MEEGRKVKVMCILTLRNLIMKEAKKLGIKHYFIEDESSRVEEQLPKSLAYLKSLPTEK